MIAVRNFGENFERPLNERFVEFVLANAEPLEEGISLEILNLSEYMLKAGNSLGNINQVVFGVYGDHHKERREEFFISLCKDDIEVQTLFYCYPTDSPAHFYVVDATDLRDDHENPELLAEGLINLISEAKADGRLVLKTQQNIS